MVNDIYSLHRLSHQFIVPDVTFEKTDSTPGFVQVLYTPSPETVQNCNVSSTSNRESVHKVATNEPGAPGNQYPHHFTSGVQRRVPKLLHIANLLAVKQALFSRTISTRCAKGLRDMLRKNKTWAAARAGAGRGPAHV